MKEWYLLMIYYLRGAFDFTGKSTYFHHYLRVAILRYLFFFLFLVTIKVLTRGTGRKSVIDNNWGKGSGRHGHFFR